MRVPSLQNSALSALVTDFERFYRQCILGNDPNTEKCLGLYSEKLVQRYSALARKIVKDEYINILINPYLTNLNLKLFYGFSPGAVLNRIKECGEALTVIDLSTKYSPMDVLTWIGELVNINLVEHFVEATPNVEILILEHGPYTDHHMQCFAMHWKKLKSVNMKNCTTISIDGLNHLIRTPDGLFEPNYNITCFNVKGCDVYIDDMDSFLKYFPSLRVLHYDHMSSFLHDVIRDERKKQEYYFSQLPLENLHFCEVFTYIVLEELNACPFLCEWVEWLEVNLNLVLETPTCKIVVRFPRLKILCINTDGLEEEEDEEEPLHKVYHDIHDFLQINGSQLTTLRVQEVVVSVDVLLVCCPLLKEINISDSRFRPCGSVCSSKAVFAHLERFIIRNIFCEDLNVLESIAYILYHSPNIEAVAFTSAFYYLNLSSVCYLRFLDRIASIEDVLLLRAPEIVSFWLQETKCTCSFIQKFVMSATQLEYFLLNCTSNCFNQTDFTHIQTELKNKWQKFLIIQLIYDRQFSVIL